MVSLRTFSEQCPQIVVMQQQRRDAHIRCKTTDPLLTQSPRLHPTTPKPIFWAVSIQPAPARDFWPLESRHRHFPNLNLKP